MNELEVREDDIREEHLRSVHERAHWAYLFGVLGISFLLMVLFQ